jgi:hypothetical protein
MASCPAEEVDMETEIVNYASDWTEHLAVSL